ncbi:MAG TPA: DUF697 domain-containing protein [Pseudolabrys sp.]|nr:DUF697 domain-containing protein [Pseudolabrys sp.]
MNKKKLPKAIRTPIKKSPTDTVRVSRAAAPDRTDDPVKLKMSQGGEKTAANSLTPDVQRRVRAVQVVKRFSFWSGVAGLLPVPFVDLAIVGALQVQMVRLISHVYDVPFSENRGKALVAGLAGTIIPVSTGVGMASMVKSVPVAGTAIGGLVTPALATAATYAIGMVFIQHFASGGTLLDFEPPNYREFITREMQLHLGRPSKAAPVSSDRG